MKVLPLSLAALLLAGPPAVRDEPALERIDLARVFADPGEHLGRELRVTFQVDLELETWNPYVTRFGTRDFAALRVWSDGQLLWEPDAYERPEGFVFVRRGTPVQAELSGSGRFARWEARVRVDQIFLDLPWIEVLEAAPLGRTLDQGSLIHASRGLTLLEEGSPRLARAELYRARVPTLPRHALDELDRLIAECERELQARQAKKLRKRR